MRTGCTKVESMGSLWWFDDAAGEYMRLPKVEQPREKPERSPDVLADAVWHPMEEWYIGELEGALHIKVGPEGRQVFAPEARIVGTT